MLPLMTRPRTFQWYNSQATLLSVSLMFYVLASKNAKFLKVGFYDAPNFLESPPREKRVKHMNLSQRKI